MTALPIEPAAVIFDLDGTLLDTEPLYTEAAQKVLDPYGATFTLELKRRVMGGDSVRSAQMTIDEFDLPMTPEEFLARREVYLRALFPQVAEITGAGDFIRRLHARRVPIGVATSSHRHLCDLKISHRDWRSLIDAVVCGDEPGLSRGKPAPDIFLLCAERLAVDPRRVVAFEDSGNGVAAARAAGMTVVAVTSPWCAPEDLAEADLLVGDFTALD